MEDPDIIRKSICDLLHTASQLYPELTVGEICKHCCTQKGVTDDLDWRTDEEFLECLKEFIWKSGKTLSPNKPPDKD